MAEEILYETYDKTLYRQGSPLYSGDGTPLTNISTLQPSEIGDGFSTGSTEMVTHALQSGTFLTGVRGWRIDAEGNAEFNDGIFRGDVVLGNTVRTINSADEIQNAINEVSAGGGGTIYLAPGTYNMTSHIDLPSFVYLIGAAREAVIIDFGNNAFSVRSIGTSGSHNLDITLNNLTIQNSSIEGVYLQYCDNSKLDGVNVYNCGGTGIFMDNCTATGIISEGAYCDGNGTGIKITNSSATSIYFTSCLNSTIGHGIEFNSVSNMSLIDSEIGDNAADGINLTSCSNIGFISLSVHDNGGQGIELVSNCNDLQFSHTVVDGNTLDGMKLTASSDRNTIVAMTFSSNGGYGVNIAASSCDNNQIIAPAFDNNSTSNINDSGTNTHIFPSPTGFGGSGADGALDLTSGTTTLDLGGAVVFTKNYTSISITGTGKLAFSNPHANGTIIILKSQGNVVLTSATVPCIDASGMGAAGGAFQTNGNNPNELLFNVSTNPKGLLSNTGTGGVAGAVYETTQFYTTTETRLTRRALYLVPGAGGGGGARSGGGSGPEGSGGNGGGALYMECAGGLNFTGTVSVAGSNGGVGNNGVGSEEGGGGGGGGSAGMFLLLYNSLVSNAGTITATGGTGGDSGTSAGTTGAYGGGSGAGSLTFAGGAGGNTGTGGSAAAGTGAGGGGAGGRNGAGAGLAGGSGGASMGGLVAQNRYFS